jgi:alkylation response protein AidB-like acyl-CoA dehydrogenase
VTSRLLVHERNSVGGGSQYWALPGSGSQAAGSLGRGPSAGDLAGLAKAQGTWDDSHSRQLVAEARVLSIVAQHLGPHVARAMELGELPAAGGSLLKLFSSTAQVRISDIEMALAGASATAWPADREDASDRGLRYVMRQTGSILSGTSEIQRNIISDRILGLPREPSLDRDVPFREVRRNAVPMRAGAR